jgi:hypothetical protein
MSDAMTDSDEFNRLTLPQPASRCDNSRRNVGDLACSVLSVDQSGAIVRHGAQPWTDADPINLSFDEPLRIAVVHKREYLEFHT